MLERLELHNFLCFKDQSVTFNSPGPVLVTGEINGDRTANNGVGKSALFEAIWFAFFGSLARTSAAIAGHVKVKFSDLELERQKNARVSNFFVNGQLQQTPQSGTKALVERLFQTSDVSIAKQLLGSALFFGRRYPFWLSLSPAQAAEMFEKLLRCDVIRDRENRATVFLNTAQATLQAKQLALEEVNKQIETLAQLKQQKQAKIEQEKRDLFTLKQTLLKDLNNFQTEQAILQTSLQELSSLVQELRQTLETARQRFLEKAAIVKALEQQLTTLSKLGDVCPTCQQPVSQDYKQEKISQLEQQLERAKDKRQQAYHLLQQLQQDLDTASSQQQDLQAQLSDISAKIRLATRQLQEVDQRLQALENTVFEEDQFLQEATQRREDIKQELTKLNASIRIIKQAQDWLKEGRFSLFAKALSFIEQAANVFLSSTRINGQISISPFKVLKKGGQKPNINVVFKRNGSQQDFVTLSDGEQQLVRLAIWLATSELIFGLYPDLPRFTVLDEPLVGLDDWHKNLVFDLIQTTAQTRQLFVIDHDAVFKERFSSTLVVSRQDNATYLYWEGV